MNRKDLFLAAALLGYLVKTVPATRDEAALVVQRARTLADLFEQHIDTEDEKHGKNQPSN